MAATTSSVYQTNIPEQLLPYQQTLLDQAAAFTDLTKYPYQQYQGERVAQLSPLTQQAMETAGQMGVAGQIGAATDIAGAAGLGALGTQYDPMQYRTQSFIQPGAAQAYMSPFMQNVVDVQQREAKRQADIAATARGAQAARTGAFGGARQAIENAEANRALQTQLGGIQAQGLQSAFQQAQQQFNQEQANRLQAQQLGEQSRQFGAGLGMTGIQNALQSANVLGSLGQQQMAQQQAAIQTQAGLGQMEQQRAQDILNQQYQDFQNYQNYPFKTLGFMSDILRGTPLTQVSGSLYQGAPTTAQNLLSLGFGAAGLNQMFPSLFKTSKDGGMVSSYADGGQVKGYRYGGISAGDVTSQANKDDIVDNLHPMGLPSAIQGAMMRGDIPTAQSAQGEMNFDAAIRRGIAAAAPYDMDRGFAAGGIVAFADEGLVKAPSTAAEATSQLFTEQAPTRPESEDYVKSVQKRKAGLEELYPASEAIPLQQQLISEQRNRIPEIERMGRGLTLIRAASALQKAGVGDSERYSKMYEELASGAEKMEAKKQAANSELMKSQLLLAQAKDLRAMGMTDKAVTLEEEAFKTKQNAFNLRQQNLRQAMQTMSTAETQAKKITSDESIHEADRKSREKIAREQIQQRAAEMNKPGEVERMLADFDDIIMGKKTHGGKTGLEGAEAYTDSLSKIGAARYGARYTGPDKSTEHKIKIDRLIQQDPLYEGIANEILMTGNKTDAKSVARRAAAQERLKELRKSYEDRYPEPKGAESTTGKPITREAYDKLPSGAQFVAPDGSLRIKP